MIARSYTPEDSVSQLHLPFNKALVAGRSFYTYLRLRAPAPRMDMMRFRVAVLTLTRRVEVLCRVAAWLLTTFPYEKASFIIELKCHS